MAGPVRGGSDYLDLGDWNAACSMCGHKRKASQLVKNWQGQWRCPEHNEPRHPQEYVRAVPDIQTPPWTQPESDVFAEFCSPLGMTGIADVGIADCAICDYISPILTPYDLPVLVKIFLTSGSSWTVPSNWNSSSNWVECVGAGGSGDQDTNPGGGGGGAYAIAYNLNLSGTIQYSVGSSGNTWFNGTAFNNASVAAEGGTAGSLLTGGPGGKAVNSRGDTKYDGGNGGDAVGGNSGGGGGGGAGGPHGAGGTGGNATATTGGVGGTGNGGGVVGGAGGVFPIPGANGNSDATWDSSHGIGSGGGGANQNGGNVSKGGNGGSYGGGGGGGGSATGGSLPGPGLIVISYLVTFVNTN